MCRARSSDGFDQLAQAVAIFIVLAAGCIAQVHCELSITTHTHDHAVQDTCTHETLSEAVTFQPLPRNRLLVRTTLPASHLTTASQVHLRFTTHAAPPAASLLLPPFLRAALLRLPLSDMQLSFTRGYWVRTPGTRPPHNPVKPSQRPLWGPCPDGETPSGVHLSATLPSTASHTHAWGNLTTSLSGPFCAALNQLAHPSRWLAVASNTTHRCAQSLLCWTTTVYPL